MDANFVSNMRRIKPRRSHQPHSRRLLLLQHAAKPLSHISSLAPTAVTVVWVKRTFRTVVLERFGDGVEVIMSIPCLIKCQIGNSKIVQTVSQSHCAHAWMSAHEQEQHCRRRVTAREETAAPPHRRPPLLPTVTTPTHLRLFIPSIPPLKNSESSFGLCRQSGKERISRDSA